MLKTLQTAAAALNGDHIRDLLLENITHSAELLDTCQTPHPMDRGCLSPRAHVTVTKLITCRYNKNNNTFQIAEIVQITFSKPKVLDLQISQSKGEKPTWEFGKYSVKL